MEFIVTDLYLDDLQPGQKFRGKTATVIDSEAIKAFARQFDPQPFHLDEAAARTTLFAGLVASGWHTMALTMRLLVDGGPPIAGGIIGGGVDELRWPKPVRPGDRLRIEFRSDGGSPVALASRARAGQAEDDHAQSERRGGVDVYRQSDRAAPVRRALRLTPPSCPTILRMQCPRPCGWRRA